MLAEGQGAGGGGRRGRFRPCLGSGGFLVVALEVVRSGESWVDTQVLGKQCALLVPKVLLVPFRGEGGQRFKL